MFQPDQKSWGSHCSLGDATLCTVQHSCLQEIQRVELSARMLRILYTLDHEHGDLVRRSAESRHLRVQTSREVSGFWIAQS